MAAATIRRMGIVVWPAFLCAAMGVGVLFSLVDPQQLVAAGVLPPLATLGWYTLGFFLLWVLCMAAAALSCFLQVSEPRPGQGK